MSAVTKVWIDEGCITCDACENICPEVFSVQEDSCVIVDGVDASAFGDDIIEAAEACPVDVIMFETGGAVEAPADEAPAAATEEAPAAPPAPAAAEASGETSLDGDRELHILFGSQSGNAEGLCALMAKKAADYDLVGHVHDMDGFDLGSMAGMKRVLIACSTWGEGEQPDNAEALYQAAKGAGAILSSTHFSVCALGDTSYEFFCRSGIEWDQVLEAMGGTRIHDRVDCDVDYDAPAGAWMAEALARIACVDGDGIFHEDMVEGMKARAAGDAGAAGGGEVATVALPEIQFTTSLFRYAPMSGETGVDAWACALPGHHSVLDLLRTLKSTQDGSLTFRDGAPSDPTTGVVVNGRLVLPGRVRLADVVRDKGEGKVLRIEPLPGFEIIRDLVVDMSAFENLRADSAPWFVGGQREGAHAGEAVIGKMDAVEATRLHAAMDHPSPQMLHASSDAVPYHPRYIGPALAAHLWNRHGDPRVSDKARKALLDRLAADTGIKAETDLASIHRQGAKGANAASVLLDAKTAVLSADGYNHRHGKHVWWTTWSIKSSGLVNETTLYRSVLGPVGLATNALTGVSARMIFGFTRTGRPMFNELLGMLAPPAGMGKMPKQFNSRVEKHHEVVSIFNEMDGRF